jgi:membrane-associated phospholipid phosphatase
MLYPFWLAVTRLGEALIMLPAALALSLWLAQRAGGQRMALHWLGLVALAALVTTTTKVAFIGWGVGSAHLNFTGVSGHTMFATAVYPLLLRTMVSTASPYWHRAAVLTGVLLALLVGVSRVKVGAHSWSEVVAGWGVGGLACGLAMTWSRVPRSPLPRWLLVGVLAWMVALPLNSKPAPTHDWVTRLALSLSGRSAPYTRGQLLQPRHPLVSGHPEQGPTCGAAPRLAWSAVGSHPSPPTPV